MAEPGAPPWPPLWLVPPMTRLPSRFVLRAVIAGVTLVLSLLAVWV